MVTNLYKLSGEGNAYYTLFREYDPILGRWWSADPLRAKYPSMSPYLAFGANPVMFVDPDGNAFYDSEEARVYFQYGGARIRIANCHGPTRYAMYQLINDPNNWEVNQIGLRPATLVYRISGQQLSNATEGSSSKYIVSWDGSTGEPNPSNSVPIANHVNRTGTPLNPVNMMPNSAANYTSGVNSMFVLRSKILGILGAVNVLVDIYRGYLVDDDIEKIREHWITAQKIVEKMDIMMSDNSIPELSKYKDNIYALTTIMNVVLTGENITLTDNNPKNDNKELSEIGDKIYNIMTKDKGKK